MLVTDTHSLFRFVFLLPSMFLVYNTSWSGVWRHHIGRLAFTSAQWLLVPREKARENGERRILLNSVGEFGRLLHGAYMIAKSRWTGEIRQKDQMERKDACGYIAFSFARER